MIIKYFYIYDFIGWDGILRTSYFLEMIYYRVIYMYEIIRVVRFIFSVDFIYWVLLFLFEL